MNANRMLISDVGGHDAHGGRTLSRREWLILLPLALSAARSAQAQPLPTRGMLHLHAAFHSRFVARDRDVVVYLPPGYDTSATHYPVFYLHDGQAAFQGSAPEVTGALLRVDRVADRLIAAHAIQPLILVAIGATADRDDEYTPFRDSGRKRGGKASAYGRMLVEELKPFIDAHYRTLTAAADTGLGGASLGGLVTLYLGLKYPKTFGKLGCQSPSVWWADRAILGTARNLASKPSLRIWLDAGTAEPHIRQNARLLRDLLIAKGWKPSLDLRYLEAQNGGHDFASWAQRIDPLLRFLFPARP